MDTDTAAKALKELGHPHRLRIFRRLVKAGFDGLPVGDLQSELGIPASSLTHHISSLVSAGLIRQDRRGRVLQCIPQYETLWGVIGFLQDECCLDRPDPNCQP